MSSNIAVCVFVFCFSLPIWVIFLSFSWLPHVEIVLIQLLFLFLVSLLMTTLSVSPLSLSVFVCVCVCLLFSPLLFPSPIPEAALPMVQIHSSTQDLEIGEPIPPISPGDQWPSGVPFADTASLSLRMEMISSADPFLGRAGVGLRCTGSVAHTKAGIAGRSEASFSKR